MIIRDLSKNAVIKHEHLEVEDIFKYDERLFMKVTNCYEGGVNSYDFTKKRLTEISEDTEVEYIPSELILHEKGWNLDK